MTALHRLTRRQVGWAVGWLIALLLSVGCALPFLATVQPTVEPTPAGPKIITHSLPELPVDLKPFEELGCTQNPETRRLDCPEKVKPAECDDLRFVPVRLGGLNPKTPLVLCVRNNFHDRAELPMIPNLCLAPYSYQGYVALQDGKMVHLATQKEFATFFAPIDSPEEALSFALAATGYSAYSQFDTLPDFRFFSDTLESTRVEQDNAGYKVNLFYYQLCGCGPHTTSVVDVQVRKDGSLEIGELKKLYEDPTQDGLCVD